jgi:formylglycine-generating enzyme required for sulfatase activity
MKSLKIIVLSFLCSLSLASYAQKDCILNVGGTVLLNDSTGIRTTEVTVREYLEFIANNHYNTALYPDSAILSKAPYRFLFRTLATNDTRYIRKINGRGYCWIKIQKQKTKDITSQLNSLLLMPITGITYKQATFFCKWVEKSGNTIFFANTPCKVNISLPTEEDYHNLILNIDSICNDNCTSNYTLNCLKLKSDGDTTTAIYKALQIDKLLPTGLFAKDANGLYDMEGNAAEMTKTEGVCMGGSYLDYAKDTRNKKKGSYTKPEYWLGFRYIVKGIQ